MKAYYTQDPTASATGRVDGDRIYLRMWVSRLTWSFTDLGTVGGTHLGNGSFTRRASDRFAASALTSPVEVFVRGSAAVYLRSSARAGQPDGYPITLTVTWRAQCREDGKPDWGDLSGQTWRYDHKYKVYSIRSLPD